MKKAINILDTMTSEFLRRFTWAYAIFCLGTVLFLFSTASSIADEVQLVPGFGLGVSFSHIEKELEKQELLPPIRGVHIIPFASDSLAIPDDDLTRIRISKDSLLGDDEYFGTFWYLDFGEGPVLFKVQIEFLVSSKSEVERIVDRARREFGSEVAKFSSDDLFVWGNACAVDRALVPIDGEALMLQIQRGTIRDERIKISIIQKDAQYENAGEIPFKEFSTNLLQECVNQKRP